MLRFFVLAVVISLAKGCCAPSQWEGMEVIQYATKQKDGTSYHADITGKVSSNRMTSMVVRNQTVMVNGQTIPQMIYEDFNKRIKYTVSEGKCQKENLTDPVPWCVAEGSYIVKHSYMGAGSSMIKTTIYHHVAMGSTTYYTIEDAGCIPVIFESSGTSMDGAGIKATIEFFGITPGIADMSVFQIPAMCGMHS